MTAPRRFSVGAGSVRKRIDRFLVSAGSLSRSRIQKLVESGAVTVNGAVERRPAHLTAPGDQIEIDLPPEPEKAGLLAEEIPLDVLYEDHHLLVLNKPPGLVVHPAPGHSSGTLVNAILHHCQQNLPDDPAGLRPGIVHRLDRDTSGVLVVAKTDLAHASLSHQMKKRIIRKEYIALCAGRPKLRKGEINAAIGRDPHDRKRMRTFRETRPPTIREAKTLYEIEREWPELNLALLRLRLVTGRTHQIRVHLTATGCPVVGDQVYGRPRYEKIKDAALKKDLANFPRQALHAEILAFKHPKTGKEVVFQAPLPDDLRRLLDSLP